MCQKPQLLVVRISSAYTYRLALLTLQSLISKHTATFPQRSFPLKQRLHKALAICSEIDIVCTSECAALA